MPKILIVEDETKFLELLKIRLEDNGYEVISANNGVEALEMVKTHKPHLIILDVLMPVMDGFKFYKELKKVPANLKIPVLIMTARGQMEDTFKEIGADEFLTKPVSAEVLLEKISKLLKGIPGAEV